MVNNLTGNNFLKFMASIWGAKKDDNTPSEKVLVEKGKIFPYLDMELFWSKLE